MRTWCGTHFFANLFRKYVRQILRRKKSDKFNAILNEFSDLNRLDAVRHFPIRSQRQMQIDKPSPDDFANFLGDLFTSDNNLHDDDVQYFLDQHVQFGSADVPLFQFAELRQALKSMKNRKSADHFGIVVEMFKHLSDTALNLLLGIYNGMKQSGIINPT